MCVFMCITLSKVQKILLMFNSPKIPKLLFSPKIFLRTGEIFPFCVFIIEILEPLLFEVIYSKNSWCNVTEPTCIYLNEWINFPNSVSMRGCNLIDWYLVSHLLRTCVIDFTVNYVIISHHFFLVLTLKFTSFSEFPRMMNQIYCTRFCGMTIQSKNLYHLLNLDLP